MTKTSPICILCSADSHCFDGALITLLSAQKETKRPLHIFFVTGEIKIKKKQYHALPESDLKFIESQLQRYNKNAKITCLDWTDELIEKLHQSKSFKTRFSPFSMMRLLADFHPELGDRVLYLDIDVVVTGDLEQIFDCDLEGNDVGMVRDEVGSHWLGKNYCNSGVILMDLKRLRENHDFDLVRKKLIKNFYFMPDQTAINRALKNKKKIMSPRFNDQHYLHEDTVIRHYCQWIKFSQFFRNVAKKPWDVEAFRKCYGPEIHRDIIEEYLALKEEYAKIKS